MEELIHLLYYLEITGDPYNLISSQQCDLFTNHTIFALNQVCSILGDPGADSGDEGKSKRAEKYDTKKSKERQEEPLGTMSYRTSSKPSPPF